MAVYAIGDVQGCFDELRALLKLINFHPQRDTLWFTGDLVNRGPKSLEVLLFVKGLGEHALTVLGNHDLHLLAVAQGYDRYRDKDTFDDVLQAPERESLLDWLRHRPLLHHDAALGFTLIHAGLPPQWDIAKAQACAAEIEAALKSPNCSRYLQEMYGNVPDRWSEDLTGWERLRFITNCFTRLRFCDSEGRLALEEKAAPGTQPAPYLPWFEVPGRQSRDTSLVFGHWAALGWHASKGVYAVDTGCSWGRALTALRLDGMHKKRFSVACPKVDTAQE